MRLVLQVKLAPDAAQASALERTLPATNDAATWVSTVSFERFGLKGGVRELRKLCYGGLKARGFGAQSAQHIIKRVADAYTTLRANIRAGNLGLEGSKRRAKAESKPIVFRPHATHTNHKISKTVVAVAQRTGRGIALEELQGIRDRVTVPRDQRARLSCWPFHQLGAFVEYKARRVGVPFNEVDPAYTSQKCPVPWCGHTARNNRPTRGTFSCRRCGFAGPADHVAGINVRDRARSARVFVNMPDPAPV